MIQHRLYALFGVPNRCFNLSDQKCEVGPLRSVESVHLVDNKEAQRLGGCFFPRAAWSRPRSSR